jgi:hypothetical protein
VPLLTTIRNYTARPQQYNWYGHKSLDLYDGKKQAKNLTACTLIFNKEYDSAKYTGCWYIWWDSHVEFISAGQPTLK